MRTVSTSRWRRWIFPGIIACLAVVASLRFDGIRGDPPRDQPLSSKEAETLFLKTIQPLLKEKCHACHGDDPKDLKGNLDLRTRAGLLKGGRSKAAVVVAGEPDKSLLYVAVTRRNPDLQMPPKENDKLSAEQVEAVRRWIAAGAPWPDASAEKKPDPKTDGPRDGIAIATSGGRSPEWTERKYIPADVWAYQPIQRPAVPETRLDGSKSDHPIDAFLQHQIKAKGINRPASAADKRTLLRRATFDLTGLPPTPEEIDAFLKDESADAFEKVIARLLKSPHYGEQWSRHWLDVVRYADTSGFSNDHERPNAWRYRDYVVRSFNQDKPFDRFIKEQIAGDELDAKDPELLIAVGFLRMGPWEQTGMSVAALTRQHFLDDVTNHVGVTFLGQALRCASCHDHKFDPVPTKDYYRLQAVFAPLQFAERELPFLTGENTASFAELRKEPERLLAEANTVLAELDKKSQAAIAAYLKERGVARITDLPESERPKRREYGLTKRELSQQKIYQKRVEYFERQKLRFQPFAFSVYDGPVNNYNSNRLSQPVPSKRDGPIQEVRILPGGALDTPAEVVTPGVLSAMHASNEDVRATAWNTIPQGRDGRRLALAQWIASPQNTLTARVIVNRVWQHHFGKGLVATANNFGKMGKRPTHPELLDWLATWFIEHDWSIKKLHALIMTSAAYQQAGTHPDLEKLRQIDPNNELLAYFSPRRLEAEEIRDGILAITGELNREAGGPGCFPEINWEVALQPRHVMGSVPPAYQPSPTPAQRNRRTIYAFRYRTLADPLLEVFNRPGSEVSCAARDQTTVAPQAFALFNGEFAHDRALALAIALEKTADSLPAQIEQAFRRCYGRSPSASEMDLCREHVAKMLAHHRANKPTPQPLPAKVKRMMVEELTGEEFTWEEELGMKNYQRDTKPWDVGPETRALADLCLVLLNSNEFLTVR